jgi:hypothetical protein
VLGVAPLRWIGVRSYGIYLWHVPILVLTTPAAQHQTQLWRAALQVAATLVVAGLSWRFVEQPIRRGALTRLWRALRSGGWRQTLIARHGLALIAGSLTLLAATGIAFAATSLTHGRHHAAAASMNSRASASAIATASTPPGLTPPTSSATASGGAARHRGRGERCRSAKVAAQKDFPNRVPSSANMRSFGDTSEHLRASKIREKPCKEPTTEPKVLSSLSPGAR